MDEILSRAGSQAMTFAIRSGISIASGFAIKRVSKFLDKLPESRKRQMLRTRDRIQKKIDVVAMSIDLIKLSSARSCSELQVTTRLIDELTQEFSEFDQKLLDITDKLSNSNESDSIKEVEQYMASLVEIIDDAIPLLNLAITLCGVSLNGSLPNYISPKLFMEASMFINNSNSAYKQEPIKVGPTFDMVLYSVFYNPSRLKYVEKDEKDDYLSSLSAITWKEEFARCRCSIVRSPKEGCEFAYSLVIEECFEDGRFHEEESIPRVKKYTLSDISKTFFNSSGKALKLESSSLPVLIFKVLKDSTEEWISLGEIIPSEFDEDSDASSEEVSDNEKSQVCEADKSSLDGPDDSQAGDDFFYDSHDTSLEKMSSSLSLLDYMLRLCQLQTIEQVSLLNAKDERVTTYLKSYNSTNNNTQIHATSRNMKQLRDAKTEDYLSMDSNINRLNNLNLLE